jgi:DNA-binding PadR family transcriptional regulator
MQENNDNPEYNSHRKSDLHHENKVENDHRHAHHPEGGPVEPGQPNFWHAWRSERHHHGHGLEIPTGQARSAKEIEEWREFFHKSFGNWPEEHWIFGGRRFSPWHQGLDSFNPFVANLLSKGGGLLPLYVLHLVAQKPRYGNEIMDLLAERTNGQWVSNPGAIYPLLTQLEREGFIKGEWEDPDKRTIRVYTILPAGQEELSRIKTIVSPKLEETIKVLQELLQDLLSPDGSSGQEPAPTPEGENQNEKGIL